MRVNACVGFSSVSLFAVLFAGAVFSPFGTAWGAPSEFGDITVQHDLPYRDPSVRACKLDIALPKGTAERPRAAIVVIHGGGWIEGDKSSFVVAETPGNILELAAAGFVGVAVNYRLSREAPYPAALTDCQAAVRWLRGHAKEYQIDPSRIGAYGNSAGGHLALLLGLPDASSRSRGKDGPFPNESSRVQCAVSDSGPLDLIAEYKNGVLRGVIQQFMNGPPQGALRQRYEIASPANYPGTAFPPVFLIYGEVDQQVDVQTADRFVTQLGQGGRRTVSYFRLAGVGHCPHSLARVPYLRPAVIEFFQRTLAKPERAPAKAGQAAQKPAGAPVKPASPPQKPAGAPAK